MEKYLNQHLTDYNQMYRVMSMMKSAQGYENLFFGVVSFEGRYYFIMEQSPFKACPCPPVSVGSSAILP